MKDPMKKRVTIQDIADALSISRNTVSKAINNSAGIADVTRELILQKAAEMGYKQFSYLNISGRSAQPSAESPAGLKNGPSEIALFTGAFLSQSHFASTMLDRMQQELSQMGYTLNTHRITKEHRRSLSLPITFRKERTAAIVCVEMFDRKYDDMLCELGIPVLFVDGPAKLHGESLHADQLYMENFSEVNRFIYDMLRLGCGKIGFIGDYEHCQSFLERYAAFRCAMMMESIPVNDRHIIKTNERQEIESSLRNLEDLPELFLCANDFIAVEVMHILVDLGLSIPGDVAVCGFDDSTESGLVSPRLTTVHIHTQSMAFSAIQLLMTRLKEPSLDYRTVYTETNLIYRESTKVPDTGV